MKIIDCRNVAEALPLGVDYLLQHGQQEASRAGPVLVAPGPVATVYARPCECVLFNAVRDANPFFSLLEAMWMLAGRDDAAFLDNYVKDFGERFAEPDGRIHGAYGKRWREHFDVLCWSDHGVSSRFPDQLAKIIEILRDEPESRQAILSMWDPEDDLGAVVKDKPCNTHAYFRVRDVNAGVPTGEQDVDLSQYVLDMMVCCRSNDIIWGAFSANACHFSIMQQYLAAMIGVGAGTYTQMSFNFHAYISELERLARRAGAPAGTPVSALRALGLPLALAGNGYATAGMAPMALVDEPASFDRELMRLMEMLDDLHVIDPEPYAPNWGFRNTFLSRTVWPMAVCMRLWRLGHRNEALALTTEIAATDWRLATTQWFARRARKPEAVAP
jgi:thymidylate synthase